MLSAHLRRRRRWPLPGIERLPCRPNHSQVTITIWTETFWLVLAYVKFLGAFEKLRKVATSFVIFVRSSVRRHGATWLPLDGFLWNLIFEPFFENLSRKFKFHYNPTKIMGTLHEDVSTFMAISGLILLRMRNVSNKSCRENENTHFRFSTFFRKSCCLWHNVEQYGGAGKAAGNMAQAHCMLDKYGYMRQSNPPPIHTHTHTNIKYCNTGFVNAPQRYVIRTVSVCPVTTPFQLVLRPSVT